MAFTTSLLRRVPACALALLLAAPDPATAVAPKTVSGKSMDQMSPAELERFVQQLNETSNWRKYRRPGDPADFVHGKPVKVMYGAGAAFGGRGMRGGSGGQAFRRSGLASRRRQLSSNSSRRRGGREDAASASSGGSSRSRSSGLFGNSRSSSSSRSSFGTGMGNDSE